MLLDGASAVRCCSVAGTQQAPILELEGIDVARGRRRRARRTRSSCAPSDAPAPEEDAFWVRDLVGMRARCGERELGEVTDVLERPANDVLVLRLPTAASTWCRSRARPCRTSTSRARLELAESFAQPLDE